MRGVRRVLEEEDGWMEDGEPPWFTFREMARRVYRVEGPTRSQVQNVRRASHRLAELGVAELGEVEVDEPFKRRRPGRTETVNVHRAGAVCRWMPSLEDIDW